MPTKCSTCNGTYTPLPASNEQYFHACPPIPDPLFQPDPAKAAFHPNETIERANKRDENLVLDATGKVTGIKAVGAGVTLF
jgi:hypothetical protein